MGGSSFSKKHVYLRPSAHPTISANLEAKRIIEKLLSCRITEGLKLRDIGFENFNGRWSYKIPRPSNFVRTNEIYRVWKRKLPHALLHAQERDFEVISYQSFKYGSTIYLKENSLEYLSSENFVNLIYLLSKELSSRDASRDVSRQVLFKNHRRVLLTQRMRGKLATEMERRAGSYSIYDLYTIFHVALRLKMAVDVPNVIDAIEKDGRYLTADDCTNTICQLIFVPGLTPNENPIGTSESERLVSAKLKKVKEYIENPEHLRAVTSTLSFFMRLGDKYEEVTPSMCCELMLACTCISHANFTCASTDSRMKALTTACIEHVYKIACQKAYNFPAMCIVEMLSSLSMHRRSRLFRKAIVSMTMLFFQTKSLSNTPYDLCQLLTILKSLHAAEVLPVEYPALMSRLTKALHQFARFKASKRAQSSGAPTFGLTSRDITGLIHPLVAYDKSLDPLFKTMLLDSFRLSIDAAQPMSIIQSLHRLSTVPDDFFLASAEIINLLISKALSIVHSLTPISLTLLYGTLSKLNSKYYVHAVIAALNARILQSALHSFSPHEIAMLLESMSRIESLRQGLENITSDPQKQMPYQLMRTLMHMFSGGTSPELAKRLFSHVAQNVGAFTPTHTAIVLHASTFLCDDACAVRKNLYDAVAAALVKQKEVYSRMHGKEIVVMTAAFGHFSYANTQALHVISTAMCRLKFVSESEISNILQTFARLKYRNEELLHYASRQYEHGESRGFQPTNVRKALCGFTAARFRPPQCLLDFFYFHTQLFDDESVCEIERSLHASGIDCVDEANKTPCSPVHSPFR
ncbi:hypothetical protein XU18_2749 [Perkinsela sp. CCAP 1560/4]|nr:hypothetical protein XU18_2749 [Perkinsela sp. CCAP 1560/4]|eukprot:KNH06244.1 hypothetical protein XU18_2749 [Perkinsela sp. CCAP 1560/4]